eukprot:13406604-Heterocapsa_arctica.AAC.1
MARQADIRDACRGQLRPLRGSSVETLVHANSSNGNDTTQSTHTNDRNGTTHANTEQHNHNDPLLQ